MTETQQNVTEEYIRANYPTITDVQECLRWVLRNEDTYYIDDLCSFYDRNQHIW